MTESVLGMVPEHKTEETKAPTPQSQPPIQYRKHSEPSQLEMITYDYWDMSSTRRGRGHTPISVSNMMYNLKQIAIWAATLPHLSSRLNCLAWSQLQETIAGEKPWRSAKRQRDNVHHLPSRPAKPIQSAQV